MNEGLRCIYIPWRIRKLWCHFTTERSSHITSKLVTSFYARPRSPEANLLHVLGDGLLHPLGSFAVLLSQCLLGHLCLGPSCFKIVRNIDQLIPQQLIPCLGLHQLPSRFPKMLFKFSKFGLQPTDLCFQVASPLLERCNNYGSRSILELLDLAVKVSDHVPHITDHPTRIMDPIDQGHGVVLSAWNGLSLVHAWVWHKSRIDLGQIVFFDELMPREVASALPRVFPTVDPSPRETSSDVLPELQVF
ncbi:hypothetical protein B296_00039542 [Ensete ventricosum]|uniref:Uncharacterized protein n=1 Tax=Ensete ventricosum TaxID=4639 RepID=A0A426XPC7_ENSVE|nr:hypothetical protein B296_00039542 [Ensete ventricosum]